MCFLWILRDSLKSYFGRVLTPKKPIITALTNCCDTNTRLLFHLRPTTRECVHLVTRYASSLNVVA